MRSPDIAGAQALNQERALLVDDLKLHFDTRDGVVRALNGVSIELYPQETLGVVGESGCGKSVLALSIMGLIPRPPGRLECRGIHLQDRNLLDLPESEMEKIRGNEIAMIFQEPMTSLNPVLTVGYQIAEAIMLHQGLSKKQALQRAVDYLDLVRIPEPRRRIAEYPHQMSGGMRQRAMIAMALSCQPKVLIADEPTTALDVTIQAQILRLIHQLKRQISTSVIMITHDLGVVAEVADRVVVLYAGFKMEQAPVRELFARAAHPYTRGLLASMPRIDETVQVGASRRRLKDIPGSVPSLRRVITGCAFAPRCEFAVDRCRKTRPPLEEKSSGHWVACWEGDHLGDGSS